MSQVNALIDGYSRMKKKEHDASKRSSGNRHEVNMNALHKVPGVKINKRSK